MIDELTVDFTCLPPIKVNAPDEGAFKKFVVAAGEVNPNTLPALYANRLSCVLPE